MTNTLTDDDFTVPPPQEVGESVTWKPSKAGDTIVATIRRRAQVDTPFAKDKTVIDFVGADTLTADGAPVDVPAGYDIAFWPTPGALDAIDAVGAKVGDKVALRLLELVDTGKGNAYRRYGAKHLGAGDVFAADKPAAASDVWQSPF